MAIQMRRGNESQFVASKMLSGEVAVSVDQNILRVCFASGTVKQVALTEDLTTAISGLQTTIEARLVPLENGASSSNSALAALTTRVGSAEAAITAQDGRLVVLETSKADVTARLASLEESNTLLRTNVTSLGTRVTTLESNVTSLQNLTTQHTSDITTLAQRVTTLQSDVQAAATQANTNKSDLDNLKPRMAAAEQNILDLSGEQNRIKNSVSDIRILSQNNKQNIEAIDSDLYNTRVALSSLTDVVNTKADRFTVGEDGLLYVYANEELIAELGPFAGGGGGQGGGGGGSVNNAVLTVRNTGWTITTISASENTLIATFTWSSLENEQPTGDGGLTVYINGTSRISRSIQQGENTVNLSSFIGNAIKNGKNVIRMQISDSYGNLGYLNLTVNLVALSIRSSFDNSIAYTGGFSFPYIMNGEAEKTAYIEVDGTVVATETSALSDRQLTASIPAQTHGTHVIRAWCEADLGVGDPVVSNVLRYEVICVATGNTTPIITSDFADTTAEQYRNINIAYRVYDPQNLTASVDLKANGATVNSITVDRTEQTWAYRADTAGALALSITCGATTRTFNLTISESSADIGAVTEGLELYLTSQGRSNGEANPDTWTYEGISASMTGFNHVSNGWIIDADGNTALRHSGSARTVIPFQIFAEDFRSTGKTIEFEFATRYVRNYDSPIITCMSGDRGIEVTSQRATLKSEQTEIAMQYKEDEHVRIAFVVEKRTENRLVYVYVNGIMSGVLQYPDGDDFAQISPVGITIGSADATVDVYNIRIYGNDLNRQQVLGNWIADKQDVEDMISAFTRNNILDGSGNIVIERLPNNLPYMVLNTQGTHLPNYKGDKVTLSGQFVNPQNDALSYTFTGAQFDVQGTSSQYYARKNFKAKYKNGFVVNGETVSQRALSADGMPINVLCFKKDVASSEGANNVELAKLFDEAVRSVYQTPAQIADSRVRQGIDGYPMVLFEDNGTTVRFVGKYNENWDKSAENGFGFVNGDESWEVLNNTSDRVLFKSADFSGSDWLNDFEARYPDTDPAYTNNAQLAEFAAFVASTDTEAATGNALPNSVTYDGTTYTADTAAYRLAKFKAEIGNYVEVNSMLFYYLFTELFLMVDSRAKNMFPSMIGTSVA